MSKSNKTKPEAPATKPEATEQKPTKITVIKILKMDAKFRGAREAWYNELKKWDGKPLADFEAHAKEKPPSTPAKGHLAGKGEPPSGWTSYFVRTGIMQRLEQEVKA